MSDQEDECFALEDIIDLCSETVDDMPNKMVEPEDGEDFNSMDDTASATSSVFSSLDSSIYASTSCLNTSTDNCLSSLFMEPADEVGQLEWMAKLLHEDNFSSEDLNNLKLISGVAAATTGTTAAVPSSLQEQSNLLLGPAVPTKPRRSRARKDQCSWSSGHHLLPQSLPMRKCLHCGIQKTPQWRMGPQGPKTLCNTCGVCYSLGRLMPEYRPAASPTFDFSVRSHSHRRVLELRQQKQIELPPQ